MVAKSDKHWANVARDGKCYTELDWIREDPEGMAQLFKDKLDEIKPEYQRLHAKERAPFLNKMAEIQMYKTWEWHKTYFWLTAFNIMASDRFKEVKGQLNRFERLLDLCQNKKFQSDQFNIHQGIEKAKQLHIKDLYTFIKTKKSGNTLYALCPFHDEKTPSFVIYDDGRKFKCHGCGAGGSPIDFWMKLKNLTFIEAIKQLGGAN